MDFTSPLNWSLEEKALWLSALASVAADITSSKGGKNEYEANPFLKKHPTDQDFDKYGLFAGGLGTLAASMLPKDYRASALGAWTGAELAITKQNQDLRRGAKSEGGLNYELMLATLLGYGFGKALQNTGVEGSVGRIDSTPTIALSKRF